MLADHWRAKDEGSDSWRSLCEELADYVKPTISPHPAVRVRGPEQKKE